MHASDDFDAVIERYHLALGEFVKGDPESMKQLWSHEDDVTLANPFGPPARGWDQVARTMERAASHYRDGETTGFESLAKHTTADLAYILEVERFKAKIGMSDEVAPGSLRTTSILRPEDGTWKVVHRHADPITAARPPESVVQN